MTATPGDDFLLGTLGNDTINALAGDDFVVADAGDDSVSGDSGSDTLFGGDDNDFLSGGAGFDTLAGELGNDTLTGGAGYDFFVINPVPGIAETDHITDLEAGEIIDLSVGTLQSKEPSVYMTFIGTAAFSGVAGEVRYFKSGGITTIQIDSDGDGVVDTNVIIDNGEFDLRATNAISHQLQIDTTYGAESAGDDSIGGDDTAELFDSGSGNDYIRGYGGNDTLIGGAGNDTLDGGDGDDSLSGGDGDELFERSRGNDTIDGGDGFDELGSGYPVGGAINVEITDSSFTENVNGDVTLFSNIEKVVVGRRLVGDFDDTIDGSAATIELAIFAGAGDDIIIAGAGDDGTIEGDSGRDTMTGGLGADTFDFDFLIEIDAVGDVVTDFEPGDRLDFFGIDLFQDDPDGIALIYIGDAAFSNTAGELRWFNAGGSTIVEIDSDGDGTGDHRVTVTNGEFALTQTDPFRLEIVSQGSSANADSMVGSNGDDEIYAGGGDDTIIGLEGRDTLVGEDGNDLLIGGDGDDLLSGYAGSDTMFGGDGLDAFEFAPLASETDHIGDFEAGDFILLGRTPFTPKDPGADLLTFIGTAAFSGVAGEFRYSKGGGVTTIEVDNDGDGAGDQYVVIDNGEFDLRTDVQNGAQLISTSAFGSTTPDDDVIFGSVNADTVNGGDGDDYLAGMEGDDVVNGGAGDDIIEENIGNDTIDGGAGFDLLSHFYGEAANATITDTSMTNALTGETDTFSNIESVTISNRLAPVSDDTLTAAGATIAVGLFGGAGDDILTGGLNDDTLEGDSGNDTLTGGAGADQFDFDYSQELGSTSDVITDLDGGDLIDFSFIQVLHFRGDPDGLNLSFLGTSAFTGIAGQFRYDSSGGQTVVEMDTDGDGTGDRFVTITNGEFTLFEITADAGVLAIDPGSLATAGSDNITGTIGDDTVDGGDGEDTIDGGDGKDSIAGGAGNDSLSGGGGSDTLNAGDGDDTVAGGDGDDEIIGGSGLGDDSYDGGAGSDTVVYTSASLGIVVDLAAGTAVGDTGDIGSDILAAIENVTAGAGDDSLAGDGADNRFIGNGGDDTLKGEDGNDSLFGGFGKDRADGGIGDDFIRTGPDNDTLIGGDGNDTLGASNRTDLLRGGDGHDLLLGSNGNDRLFGDAGDDTLLGGNGRDTVEGGPGSDRIVGGGGAAADTASYANAGAAVTVSLLSGLGTSGEATGDVLIDIENLLGSAFADNLTGDNSANRLEGGAGGDELRGQGGNDILNGQAGNDTMIGGAGADQFWFRDAEGSDRINDFDPASGDVIRLFGFGSAFDTFTEVLAASTNAGANMTINFGGGQTLTLLGVNKSDLAADDFVFG